MNDSAGSSRRLLNLGCGTCAPPEWINIDGSWNAWLAKHRLFRRMVVGLGLIPRSNAALEFPSNILIHDLRRPLPFDDQSFDGVYSSHTLEHLHRSEALALLKESRRVLKTGGRCRMLVPDLAAIVREYGGEEAIDEALPEGDFRRDRARQFCLRLYMAPMEPPRRSWLYQLYSGRKNYHSHKWMYDADSLKLLMEEAGFVDCRQRDCRDSDIPHIDQVERLDRARYGAIVEGVGR